MKENLIIMCAALLSITAKGQSVETKINTLLTKMTLAEKVGQMTQLDANYFLKADANGFLQPYVIDEKKLEEAVVKYGVGSLAF